VEVLRRIMAELKNNQHIFESLDSRQCRSILWQIFMDSRRFFSVGINVWGNLPQSLLRTTYNKVAAGIVQAHLNVPYAELLGHRGERRTNLRLEPGTEAEPKWGPGPSGIFRQPSRPSYVAPGPSAQR
jgi:hypothetical protein